MQNLTQVMENSCNVALMQIAEEIGAEEFTKYQNLFGFGEYTGLDLPGNASGILYSAEKMGSVDLATNSFGQNFNATMTQVMAGFCSLINGGNYYKPHIVKQIVDADGQCGKPRQGAGISGQDSVLRQPSAVPHQRCAGYELDRKRKTPFGGDGSQSSGSTPRS